VHEGLIAHRVLPPARAYTLPALRGPRFSRMEFLRMLGVFDSAGRAAARGCRATALVAFLQSDAVGSPHHLISSLNTQPTDTPVQRFKVQPYDCPRMARGQWFATPSLYDSFIRYSMPVHPGAIQIFNLRPIGNRPFRRPSPCHLLRYH